MTLDLRGLRLATGLVLTLFVTGHMANLMLGMHSLAAMEHWRPWLMGPWRSAPGQALLVCSALVHIALGLYSITQRRSLTMSKTDVVQLCLGLVTPPLLLNHAIVMHMAGEVTPKFDATYGQMLAVYWSFSPGYALQQLCVVMAVWIHAAVGLYSWLVLKPVWKRIGGGLILPVLFAIPVLALIGFAEAGKEVVDKLASDPAWRGHITDNLRKIVQVTDPLNALQARILLVYGLLVLAAAAVFGWRMLRERTTVQVAYDEGFSARGRRGLSLLEMSLANDIPHAHVCSARGRCGTCRVRVETGAESLSPKKDSEIQTLARVGAPEARLACQARVLGQGVSVTRLLPAYADASAARAPEEWVAP